MQTRDDVLFNNRVLVYVSEYSAMRSEITQLSAKQQNLLIASFAVSGYAFTTFITSATNTKSKEEIKAPDSPPNPSSSGLQSKTRASSPVASHGSITAKQSQAAMSIVTVQPTTTNVTQSTTTPTANQGGFWLLLCLVLCGLGFLFCDADRAIIRNATYIEHQVRRKLVELLADPHLLEWERYIRGDSTVHEHDLPPFKWGPWNAAFQGALILLPSLGCFVAFYYYSDKAGSSWVPELLSALVSLSFFVGRLIVVASQRIPFRNVDGKEQ